MKISVRVMIREREGYAAGGAEAVEQLARLAAGCAALGVDGIVRGFLRDRRIDEATMDAVLGGGDAGARDISSRLRRPSRSDRDDARARGDGRRSIACSHLEGPATGR